MPPQAPSNPRVSYTNPSQKCSPHIVVIFKKPFCDPPLAGMSTLEDLDDMERESKEDKDKDGDKDAKKPNQDGDAEMKDVDGDKKEEEDLFDPEILHSSTRDVMTRKRLLENDMRIMKSEFQRLTHEQATMKEKIKDNLDKIENNRFYDRQYSTPLTAKHSADNCLTWSEM